MKNRDECLRLARKAEEMARSIRQSHAKNVMMEKASFWLKLADHLVADTAGDPAETGRP